MKVIFDGKIIPIFSLFRISSETLSFQADFYSNVTEFIAKSDAHGYSGILLPESNATPLNPWFFANLIYSFSKTLSPFIAINPSYIHPFYAAKYIANISAFANRPLYINYITGTGLFDSTNLGDKTTHNSKYERLQEYIQVVSSLLDDSKTVSFSGEFYQIQNLKLAQNLSKDIRPFSFIAGNSESSLNVIRHTLASRLAMAMTLKDLTLLNKQRDYNIGFHFGIIGRECDDDAKNVLKALCPKNKQKEIIQQYTTQKSNVVWKKELLAKSMEDTPPGVYNLIPFATGCSDVPYLVGTYQNVAQYIYDYIKLGLNLMVFEIPNTETDEFLHIEKVLSRVQYLINNAQTQNT